MTNLKFNVAQLLRETIGSRRNYTFQEESLPLDETLTLRHITGKVYFTRTASGVIARIRASGVVRLVCVRSLDEFDQRVEVDFKDEFHSVIDIIEAKTLPKPTEEDPFLLDTFHMADIGEAIREYTLLELPLSPVSEAYRNQPVSYTIESKDMDAEDEGHQVDQRLEILKRWSQKQK